MTAGLFRSTRGSRSAQARGQGLVEFALVLPVFMFAVFGVVDGGRYVYQNTVLSQAAREGARLAAVEASWIGSVDPSCGASGGPICPANFNALKADALVAANRMVAPFGPITNANFFIRCDAAGAAPTGSWTGASCTNHSTNNIVSVRVVLTFVPITPIAGQFVVLTVSGAATMVIN
jgi:Flp pilus assembly protein TadG